MELPIKGHVCVTCLDPIHNNVYRQCLTCSKVFCINHEDESSEETNLCPECRGKLIIFPKCCDNCGLEFATVSQLHNLEKCPCCNSDGIISPFHTLKVNTTGD